MTGYHFVGKTLKDGQSIPPDGEWLEHSGPVVPCKSGLHASEHPFDALRYAPGATLCRVELDGDLQSHGNPVDKWAGRRRRIIERIDATCLLRRFAADQALSVAHLWDMPSVVKEYLTTLDESKRDAARAATETAARAAAETAAWDAARAATETAAWAAETAAWDAARAAAETAAVAATWDAAAWDATWAARDDFKARVEAAWAIMESAATEQAK